MKGHPLSCSLIHLPILLLASWTDSHAMKSQTWSRNILEPHRNSEISVECHLRSQSFCEADHRYLNVSAITKDCISSFLSDSYPDDDDGDDGNGGGDDGDGDGDRG